MLTAEGSDWFWWYGPDFTTENDPLFDKLFRGHLRAVYTACGGTQPEPTTAGSAGETCPLIDAGPPPVCPRECRWDGKECRKHSGIIIYDGDAGYPTPVPTSAP